MTKQNQTIENEKIVIGTHVDKEVSCSNCGKKGTTAELFSYIGKHNTDLYLCANCKAQINDELQSETKNIKYFGAIGLGIVAGIVGAIAWYYIVVLTGYEIGYVALGLGYLIGFAVYFGGGKKRNHKLQILAAILTALTIFFAEHAIFNHMATEYVQSHLSEFPDFAVGDKAYVSLFNSNFLSNLVSPISLVIFALGIYFAYKFLRPRKI